MSDPISNTYTNVLKQQEQFFAALLEGRVIPRNHHGDGFRVVVLPDPNA